MKNLVYECNPTFFTMIYFYIYSLLFTIFIGYIVYQFNQKMEVKAEKQVWYILGSFILIFFSSSIIHEYYIYKKVKNILHKPDKWIFIEGEIKDYHYKGFGDEYFTLNDKYFGVSSLIGGFNPITNKKFTTMKKEVIDKTRKNVKVKIAYIDKLNPIIIKMWIK